MRGARYLLSFVIILGLVSSANGQTPVYTTFPQLAFGGGWSCDFFVNNPGLATSTGLQISFFGDDGTPLVVNSNLGNAPFISFDLEPGETKVIRASLPGDTTVSGYAVLRRFTPSPATATMVVRFKSGTQVLTQLGLPQQYTVQHYSFPVEVDASASTNTGIAIANPTFNSALAKAQTFVISLIAPDGSLHDSGKLTLPIGGHVSMMVNDARLFPNLTSFTGTATISAARGFGFLALRLEGGALGSVAVEEGSVLPPAKLAGTPSPETEPNDSRGQAQALTLPALITGTISSQSGQDYFSFSGKQGDVVTAMAETEGMSSDLDTILTLEDASGAMVSANDQNFLFFQNDSFLQLALPADGTYYLRVTSWTEEGGPSFVYRLHVCNRSAAPLPQEPTIQSISPSQGSPGSSFTLTITGSNLAGASAVGFSPSSGITVSNLQSTATQVTTSISIASGATTGARQVSVTTPAGTSNSVAFTIAGQAQAPTISSISPTSGNTGSSFTLTINGTNLTGATGVSFSPSSGITVSNVQSTSSTRVTASITIASGATTGTRQVSVTTPGGTSNTRTFTVSETQAGPYDGTWTGTTGQGKSFSFLITGNALREINFAGSISGACSAEFSGKTTTNLPLEGTQISFTTSAGPGGVSLEVNGSFTSTSTANGTVKMTLNPPPAGQPGCSGWVTTTWSATKQ